MTIDAYLAELERLLPRIARRRLLAEAREHLRDSASRHVERGLARHVAEAAAVTNFGSADVVARRLAAEGAIRETRIATLIALGAVVLFVFPLYVVPENTLPPATWAEKPDDLAVVQSVSVVLWLVASALAAASTGLAWTRWSRFAAPTLIAACAAVSGSTIVAAVFAVRWFAATPMTPNWALAGALAGCCLLACGAAATWTLVQRRQLAA